VDDDPSVNRPLAIAVSPSQDLVYAVNIFNFQITTPGVSVFSVDRANGDLTFLPPVAPSVVASPQTMVIDPSGRFAYLTSFFGEINGYVIAADGSLTANPAVTELDTTDDRGLQTPTFNLTGNVLYVTDRGDDSITVFDVNTTDGSLSFRHADLPTQAGDRPIASALSVDGNFLYVSNSLGDSVSSYGNAAVGDLTLAFNVAAQDGPQPLAVHPSLPVLYVASGSRRIQSFTTGGDGSLTPLGTILPTGLTPASVLVAPSGQYVYVVCRGNTPGTQPSIDAFTVDSTTGALSALASFEFPELSFPSGAVIVSAQGL
jgi:6-phosphogluconolactonase (cycloisomerase 2 family)